MRDAGRLTRWGRGMTAVLLVMARGAGAETEPVSPYAVVWRTPSADDAGSMPLGNGEIGVNAWIEPSGELRLYIGRTDAWDENGRLLKVGGLAVATGRAVPEQGFRQSLDVRTGVLCAEWGRDAERVALRLWVDALRPGVCVEIETARPSAPVLRNDGWRTQAVSIARAEVSDTTHGLKEPLVTDPDVTLAGVGQAIGWYHHNTRSPAPSALARVQGMADWKRVDPLLHRIFGAWVTAERPERLSDTALRSAAGTRHVFDITVHTAHPSSPEAWIAETRALAEGAARIPAETRRAAHEAWWAAFAERSRIEISPAASAGREAAQSVIPTNGFPLHIGMDRQGGTRFTGELGRCAVYAARLSAKEIATLARTRDADARLDARPCALAGVFPPGHRIPAFAEKSFPDGLTVEVWVKPDALRPMRIVDQCTPGQSDGFLFDTHPGAVLRLINGRRVWSDARALRAGVWQHAAFTIDPSGAACVYLDGLPADAQTYADEEPVDEAFAVSRGVALQRYITACAGRGRYPVKFNGSLFTVSHPNTPGHADYRRWGPGYWWQNTRLPYLSMCAAGDTEMMRPLFRMYAEELLPLFRERTRRWLGQEGAFFPECVYFWGDLFPETYGWQPFESREDKLQPSGWHKWEWVGSLELSFLMLDYWEHTQDTPFLTRTALPAIREFLTFFDQRYARDAEGRYVMHPAQALETWWACTNPAPEVAGLQAVTERLLALPAGLGTEGDRAFWRRVRERTPELPVARSPDGNPMLAPATAFARKRNSEVPELYGVFPFRRVAFDKPNAALGREALKHRKDRGPMGWRQDELFMATLGEAEPARAYLVRRARSKHAGSRFPAFWGPNYDWIPDQDHGAVLVRAAQLMLLQSEGRRLWLRPAWPRAWDCRFKLHAPYNTVVQGEIRDGRLIGLEVTPASRRADVVDAGGQ